MAMRMFIELDLVRYGQETGRGIAHGLTADLDVEFVVVNEVGPASGHPQVLFIGTEDQIMIVDHRYRNGSRYLNRRRIVSAD